MFENEIKTKYHYPFIIYNNEYIYILSLTSGTNYWMICLLMNHVKDCNLIYWFILDLGLEHILNELDSRCFCCSVYTGHYRTNPVTSCLTKEAKPEELVECSALVSIRYQETVLSTILTEEEVNITSKCPVHGIRLLALECCACSFSYARLTFVDVFQELKVMILSS